MAENLGIDHDTIARIFGEVFARGQAYENLRYICDEIGGRLAGSKEAAAAEKYAYGKLAEYGLDRVAFEPFTIVAWKRGLASARALSPLKKDLTVVALGKTPVSADARGQVIDLGHGSPSEFKKAGREVAGRIVLCDTITPRGERFVHRSEKMLLATNARAKGFIMITEAGGNLPQTGTCSFGKLARIPGLGITKEHGEWLRRMLAAGREVAVEIKMRNSSARTPVRNVVGEIRGSQLPEEIVIVGGHYDSWDLATGAIDNGIGSAAVMEAARVISALGIRARRTIRFILFAAEEVGLMGSTHHVKRHRKKLDDIVAMMNLDMTGDPLHFHLVGRPKETRYLEKLAKMLAPFGMTREVSIEAGLHSDHQPFMLEGVPIIGFAAKLDDEMGRYYHSAGDAFDKVSARYLANLSAAVAVTMVALANVRSRPWKRMPDDAIRDSMLKSNLKDPLIAEGLWRWKK
jgi:carboxypeptidase Q